MDGAELREGVDDIAGAMAAEALVFVFVEDLDLGGAVGLGEDFRGGRRGLERDFRFGGIFMPARGAGQLFAGFDKAVVDRLPVQQRVRPALFANDFHCTHGA